MALMQIIEFRTTDITAAFYGSGEDWLRATEGKRGRRPIAFRAHPLGGTTARPPGSIGAPSPLRPGAPFTAYQWVMQVRVSGDWR